MARILRIINRLNLGGPTFNVTYLTHYLAPEHETMLVSGVIDDDEASSEFILAPFRITPVYIPEMKRELSPKNDYAAYKKLVQIINQFKPDIVHTHAAKAGALGRLAAAHCGVKVIVHTFHGHVFHSYFSPLKTQFFLQTEKYLARKSTAIIAISDLQKKELTETYNVCDESKITVVPLGFDLNRFTEHQTEKRTKFRTHYLLNDDEIAVAIIGRLVPVKNHAMFVRGAQQAMQGINKKVRFFIVGDGECKKEITQLLSELKLDYTEFTTTPRKALFTLTSWIINIDEVLAGVDIVALTSFNEGTPVSIIEAQTAGKPVIATNVGGIQNIVTAQSAILVPSNDVNEFAIQLHTLLSNDTLRRSMTNVAIQDMLRNYCYTRLCSDMNALYKKLLA
ncbi:MAG: glycosyltransferase [Bacteroidia bacterium]|nr:glycosyltransferase [Bacteroidia bacterium]